MAERVHKSLLNAKVGIIFYFTSIIMTFFSRRIFLDNLGADFIGLTGTISSILGFLNITEVGIATSIGYFLYKPLANRDQDTINEIVSLFGWLYRIVGTIILCGGIIISLFFPFVFSNSGMPLGIIFFMTYSFLGSDVIGYYFNYRHILLDSDQKTYKYTIWIQTGGIVKTIVQILLAYYYKNYYIFVGVEFVFCLFICWAVNYVIDKEYPWLQSDKSKGKLILKRYPEILKKTKQVFIHRMKNFFLSKSDEILVFAFESLRMVTCFGNYMMIVGRLTGLFNTVFTGMNASIGNLVAEGNQRNIRKVFWEFATFRYWITGIFIIVLTFIINPFIGWWLGPQYILKDHIVFLVLLNMYIMLTRPSVDLFINAYGLYDDVWAAYTEGAINLIITLVIGYFYGLIGILLGKTISMILLVVIWKPYFLYRHGFKQHVAKYWRHIIIHYLILLLCLAGNYFLALALSQKAEFTLISILLYAICISLPIIVLYTVFVYLFTPGMKDLGNRVPVISKIQNKLLR
ncbi:hypothetical protein SAMN04487827_0569 [Prevotella sp. khp7]|uniref:lipopolysaccharide biosynthesis protein n=1 Tax=Prevotella sp. khp7 TaxID=1761885 RepID=UPI0008AD7788|nr:hypothetical protein [Prevotella sp. khp7]SEV86183.1 hypothetical protein SAMN04487827_0569 [Prevotella sp. khp7]